MAEADRPVQVLLVSGDEAVINDAHFGFPSNVAVAIAADAREARTVLEALAPDVVVVDLRSGSAGGFAVARDMSQIAVQRDVPVLILLERDQDAWLAREAGAALHRTKPVTAESLAADTLSLVS